MPLEILRLIANHVKANHLGKTYAAESGFLIERDSRHGSRTRRRVRPPRTALPDLKARKAHSLLPDLAVEVVSPNDRPAEVSEKVEAWLAAGTRMVWVVEPANRTLTLHAPGSADQTLTAQDAIDGGEVLPGFSCKVGDFFD